MNWKNSFKENLNVLVEKAGKKKGQIAEELGIKGTTFGNYLTGESNPTLQGLIDISKYFGISETQLIHGNISDHSESPVSKSRLEYGNDKLASMQREINAMDRAIEIQEKLIAELKHQLDECRSRNSQVEEFKK